MKNLNKTLKLQSKVTDDVDAPPTAELEKKKRIAAAVKKAKAKQAEKSAKPAEVETVKAESAASTEQDVAQQKKARIAAAVAKSKSKETTKRVNLVYGILDSKFTS